MKDALKHAKMRRCEDEATRLIVTLIAANAVGITLIVAAWWLIFRVAS